MARLEDITNKPSRLAAGRRAGKQQQQPAAGASPQPAAPEPAVAADPHTQPPQPQSEQLSLELEDVDELLRSFRRLDFEPCEQQLADEQQQQAPPLSQQDSPASTATASSSRLGSPLAAFAAAKARLARSNSDAGSLISATLQRLGRPEPAPDASTPTAPPARSKPLGGLDASLLARAPQVQLQQAGAAATATALDLVQQQQRGVGNPLLQHQRQRSTLLLKERLRSTMQLCESLHEQVGWAVARGLVSSSSVRTVTLQLHLSLPAHSPPGLAAHPIPTYLSLIGPPLSLPHRTRLTLPKWCSWCVITSG